MTANSKLIRWTLPLWTGNSVSPVPRESRELLDAVAYLDKNMREIRDTGKITSIERIAIMAALNITNELLTTRIGGGIDLAEFKRRIDSMQTSIDRCLKNKTICFD